MTSDDTGSLLMLVTATSGAVRLMGGWVFRSTLVRRADTGLAYGAARNAAAGVRDHQLQRREALRTMGDLTRLAESTAVRLRNLSNSGT